MTSDPLDLRAWLDEMRKLGELSDVRGADWNLELGAISELNVKKDAPPALLFDEIKGYPKGFRVLTCSTSSPARLSSILRLPMQKTHKGLVEALRGKPAQWQAGGASTIAVVGCKSGRCWRTYKKEARSTCSTFPSPLWHELDGGRYIGTGCSVVTRDLDSRLGQRRHLPRAGASTSNHVALDMVPGKHGRIHYEKHKAAGKRFPVAIVLRRRSAGLPHLRHRGAVRHVRVQLHRRDPGQTGTGRERRSSPGCRFPAASEIVLEGHVEPNDERTEGPFGEFHGYYPGKAGTAPVVTVESVYFRNDPIIVGSPPAKPPNDYSYSKAVMRSALLHRRARRGRRARREGGVGARDRRRAHVQRRRDQAALCRPRAPGRPHPQPVRRRRLHVALFGGGRRGHRSVQPAGSDVGGRHAHRPAIDIDIIQRGMGSKNDPMFVAYPLRRAVQLQGDHRRLPPVGPPRTSFPPVAEASKELQEKTRAKWKDLL